MPSILDTIIKDAIIEIANFPANKKHLLDQAPFHQQNKKLRPLYPWAGGKKKLLKRYAKLIPSLDSFDSFVEPFFGGGAFFCNAVNDSEINEFTMNDINTEIVQIYKSIQSNPELFIAKCQSHALIFNNLNDEEKRKEYFYFLRDLYTSLPVDDIEASSILLILLKLAFGGTWKSSKENNRFWSSYGGKGKKVNIDPDLIRSWHLQLQNTNIKNQHYRDIEIPQTPSLIFCDPPYRGTKIDYSAPFKDADHIELIKWCEDLARQGHTVILTNQDIGDGFFDLNLPTNVTKHLIDYKYTAGTCRKNQKAKDVKEIIVIFHPNPWIKELNKISAFDFEQFPDFCIAANDEYYSDLKEEKFFQNLVDEKIWLKRDYSFGLAIFASIIRPDIFHQSNIFTTVIKRIFTKSYRFYGKWEFAP